MSIFKRIPWWGWGLIVSAVVAIHSAFGDPYAVGASTGITGQGLVDILFVFASGAVVYVPIAGLIAWASRRFGRSAA